MCFHAITLLTLYWLSNRGVQEILCRSKKSQCYKLHMGGPLHCSYDCIAGTIFIGQASVTATVAGGVTSVHAVVVPAVVSIKLQDTHRSRTLSPMDAGGRVPMGGA